MSNESAGLALIFFGAGGVKKMEVATALSLTPSQAVYIQDCLGHG